MLAISVEGAAQRNKKNRIKPAKSSEIKQIGVARNYYWSRKIIQKRNDTRLSIKQVSK